MKFSSGITILLLTAFLWLAWRGNLFPIVYTWDFTTWAIMFGALWVGWVSRNEFGGL